jgi:hypothetical protein
MKERVEGVIRAVVEVVSVVTPLYRRRDREKTLR